MGASEPRTAISIAKMGSKKSLLDRKKSMQVGLRSGLRRLRKRQRSKLPMPVTAHVAVVGMPTKDVKTAILD